MYMPWKSMSIYSHILKCVHFTLSPIIVYTNSTSWIICLQILIIITSQNTLEFRNILKVQFGEKRTLRNLQNCTHHEKGRAFNFIWMVENGHSIKISVHSMYSQCEVYVLGVCMGTIYKTLTPIQMLTPANKTLF